MHIFIFYKASILKYKKLACLLARFTQEKEYPARFGDYKHSQNIISSY